MIDRRNFSALLIATALSPAIPGFARAQSRPMRFERPTSNERSWFIQENKMSKAFISAAGALIALSLAPISASAAHLRHHHHHMHPMMVMINGRPEPLMVMVNGRMVPVMVDDDSANGS
jgi:hypothetical protein